MPACGLVDAFKTAIAANVPCDGIGFGGEEQPRDGHVAFANAEHQGGAWDEQAKHS